MLNRLLPTALLRCMLLGVLAFAGIGALRAQGKKGAKTMKATPPITSFGFTMLTGGVIVITAALDNYKDSLNFILDTGSGGISLDSTTVAILGVPSEPSGRTIRGLAGIRKVDFAYNHKLHLPGLTVDSLDFHINDYEMLSGVYGMPIDGIIGYSFLRRYILAIDFDVKMIRVFKPGDYPYPRGGHMLKPAIAGLPMQYAVVGDQENYLGRFYLDTGAGLNFLLNEKFVIDSNLLKPGKRTFRTIAEGLGGKKELQLTVIRYAKLGKYKFKRVPVYMFDDEFNITAYPHLAGLIGNDLLRRFNLVINYSRSEVHLLPNKSFREQFDYSYTGLDLYQVGDVIMVTDVLEGSPAAKAGLQEEDIVIGVGTVFGNDMQAFKNALQDSGRRTKLLIMRNGELIDVLLLVENINKKR